MSAYIAKYNVVGVDDSEAKIDLQQVAHAWKMDTADTESRMLKYTPQTKPRCTRRT